MGASGAPSPPAATSAERKSETTSILERRGGARAVAELPRQAFARPMQDGLAVQANKRDARAGNGKLVEKRLDRGDMGVSHQALELELRRLGFAQVGDHRAQALRDRLRVRESRRGPGPELRLAVAFDQRDVDSVHRRAADDADRGSSSPTITHRLRSDSGFRSDWRQGSTARPTGRSRWPRARRRTDNRTAD